MNEEELGGMGFSGFFRSILSAIIGEELIERSPKGQILEVLLDYIMKTLDDSCCASIAATLIAACNTCLVAGKKYKLPSLSHGAVWSAFHQMRTREDILHAWNVFVLSNIPISHRKESKFTLQIILDRMLKKMIKNKALHLEGCSYGEAVRPMTCNESNATRYMAGYIAVKLMRKYKKHTKNAVLQKKNKLFVRILQRMKASEQPGEPDSLSEYTTLWSELIDRGGLYHINHNVFNLVECIEMIVRHQLNIPDVQSSYIPGTDISKSIHEEVLNTHSVLSCWEKITEGTIPPKFEAYSLELLAKITDLWITIRGHSFTKDFTMNFERKYKKGTRKSLKNSDN